MCGLLGWMVTEQMDRLKLQGLAILLAHANDERGGDSYGFYGGSNATDGKVYKGVGDLLPAHARLDLSQHRFLLAHTRFATTGEVTPANSHPFIASGARRIIGAHNGVVQNHAALNLAHTRTCAVDSEHIFRHLAEEMALQEITAYGAITYIDTDQGELFAGRFNGGTLAVAKVADGLVWSSEEKTLTHALAVLAIPVLQMFSLKDRKQYRLSVDGIKKAGAIPCKTPVWTTNAAYGYQFDDWTDYREAAETHTDLLAKYRASSGQADGNTAHAIATTPRRYEGFSERIKA